MWSLRQFARHLSLSPSYYSKIERGEVVASLETYEALFDALSMEKEPLLASLGMVDSETMEAVHFAYECGKYLELRRALQGLHHPGGLQLHEAAPNA